MTHKKAVNNMTIRIVAGKITKSKQNGAEYQRTLQAWDAKLCFMQHTVYANTKEELKILDEDEHSVNIACDNLQYHHNEEDGCISNGAVIRTRKGTPECVVASNA